MDNCAMENWRGSEALHMINLALHDKPLLRDMIHLCPHLVYLLIADQNHA